MATRKVTFKTLGCFSQSTRLLRKCTTHHCILRAAVAGTNTNFARIFSSASSSNGMSDDDIMNIVRPIDFKSLDNDSMVCPNSGQRTPLLPSQKTDNDQQKLFLTLYSDINSISSCKVDENARAEMIYWVKLCSVDETNTVQPDVFQPSVQNDSEDFNGMYIKRLNKLSIKDKATASENYTQDDIDIYEYDDSKGTNFYEPVDEDALKSILDSIMKKSNNAGYNIDKSTLSYDDDDDDEDYKPPCHTGYSQ